MCDKCEELDFKIQQCRRFITAGLDAVTVQRIHDWIGELERRKEAVQHPDTNLMHAELVRDI